jgi:DNA-binding GntR family transcriptional regulator
MYQSSHGAEHSNDEHQALVKALAAKDEARAVQLMDEHLSHVMSELTFDRKPPTSDIALALS